NFTITSSNISSDVVIQVFDVTGKLIKETTDKTINCSDWNNGVYFIRTKDKNAKVVTEKVVVQH
ncbi:MAG: T9SS type A sorting domain-containing protein, partial [Bacteroidia bacterium]|nr:T9SS type A sorting domain-containing protein [Bacteroidia bacterium]